MENGCSFFKISKTAPFLGLEMRPLRDYKTIFFCNVDFNRKKIPYIVRERKF